MLPNELLREMQTLGKNGNLGGKQWNHSYLPHFYHYAWNSSITNLFLWILKVFSITGASSIGYQQIKTDPVEMGHTLVTCQQGVGQC